MESFFNVINVTEFIIVSVVVYFLINCIKKLGNKNSRWFKISLTILPLIFGSLLGLIPNFLYGNSIWERMLVGFIAGSFSGTIYGVVKKRIKN